MLLNSNGVATEGCQAPEPHCAERHGMMIEKTHTAPANAVDTGRDPTMQFLSAQLMAKARNRVAAVGARSSAS